jgi:hypothetical protein
MEVPLDWMVVGLNALLIVGGEAGADCETSTEVPAMAMVAVRELPALAAIDRPAVPEPVKDEELVSVIQLGSPETLHGQ